MSVGDRPGPPGSSDEPPMPADAATLGEILSTLEGAGFRSHMAARPGGRVACFSCSQESRAADLRIEALGRTEGASDPADMLAVVGVRCPACGAQGAVVLGYGPEADADDAAVLTDLGVTGR